MIAAERLLPHLQGVRPSGIDRWTARCPAHDDHSPSLSIRKTGDRVLVHCHAGCRTENILQALGIESMRILFDSDEGFTIDTIASQKRMAVDGLKRWSAQRLNFVCGQLREINTAIEIDARTLRLLEDALIPRTAELEDLAWERLADLLKLQSGMEREFEILNDGSLLEKLELWRQSRG